jgi:potassium efflux system protein
VLEVGIEESNPAFSLARSLAERDARLRNEQVAVNERLIEIRGQIEAVSRQRRALNERLQTANRIVDSASGSEALGRVLLTYWSELHTREAIGIQDRLGEEAAGVVIRRIGLEEELSMLVNAAGYLDRRLMADGLDPGSIPASTRESLLELTRGYRERLRTTINAQSEHIDALRTLDRDQSSMQQLVAEYRKFLEEILIWIPNHPPLWKMEPGALAGNAAYLLETARTLSLSVGWNSTFAIIAALVVFGYRSRLAAVEENLNARVDRPESDSVWTTTMALGVAALRAAPLPLLIFGAAQTFDAQTSEANQSLADLLLMTSQLVFCTALMLAVTEPSGIGPVHFQWQPEAAGRLHSELSFLLRWWVPISVLAVAANRLTPQVGEEAIARILMLLAVLVLAHRLAKNQLKEIRSAGSRWFAGTANRFRSGLVILLTALMLAIVYGQVFLVTVVLTCVVQSAAAGVALLLIYSALIRWLRVVQARLYPAAPEALAPEVDAVDTLDELDRIGGATRQLVNVFALAAALVVAAVIWEPLLPAFDALARVKLWSSTEIVGGDSIVNQITLATLVTVIGLIGITIYAAMRLPSLLEIIFLSRTNLSAGARYTVSTLLNYLIIGTGIIMGLAALGLRWSQLQWLIAALGVGIGFGLQEIVANFISGLIILFERPIRIGDIVTVGDKDGIVTRIRIRATTIRDWDGKELLVPNKEFITGRLLNWTLSDPQTRLVIPVGIAYDSDVEKALGILRDIVTGHPRIVEDPEPLIVFENFGDNSLELSARAFIDSMEGRMVVLTELRTAIYRAFREAGIVIAFPQRDVHFDTDKPLHVSIERSNTDPSATR